MREIRFRRRLSGSAAILAVLFTLCACHRPRHDAGDRPIVIRVLTVADTAPQQAVVTLRVEDRSGAFTLTPVGDGRYSGRIPASTQRAALSVMLPEHEVLRVPLWIPTSGPIEYTIRPRALIPVRTINTVRVIGDFNGFKEETGVLLTPTSRGTLRTAVAFRGDSSRFYIMGLGDGAPGAWMPVRSWALVPVEGRQRFAGVLRPERDSLIFEVDTSRRPTVLRAPSVVSVTSDTSLALANSLASEREDLMFFSRLVHTFLPSDTASTREPAVARARQVLTTATDYRVRGEALVTSLSLLVWQSTALDSASASFFRDVPPGSSLLRDLTGGYALRNAFGGAMPPTDPSMRAQWRRRQAELARAYMLPVARNTVNDSFPRINAYLTLTRTLESLHDSAGVDQAIAEAVAVFPTNPGIATLPRSMGSGQVLRVGAKFPNFHLKDLDGAQNELTNELFTGKFTLVDFWGTWCGPCVSELPSMHNAFEAFKGKGFNILSISSDESVDAVKRFRQGKWPMPWMHSWSGAGISTPALSALGVLSFPTAILVDGDGRIVAINGAVRGDSLQLTLARFLH